jgi:CBS domain-containing protein
MPLETLIRKNITYALLNTSIQEVAEAMREDGVGAVLVVDGGIPQGVITDRDIVLRCVCEGRDPSTTVAEEIMTRGVETVSLDQGIHDVAHAMRAAQVRRVAVVDDAGNAVGLLSFDDVFDLLTQELYDLREAVQPARPKIVNQAA